MAEDFLSDDEMAALEKSSKVGGPDFLTDDEMAKVESSRGGIPKSEGFLQKALGQASQIGKPIQQGDNPLMAGAKTAFGAMASPFSHNVTREAQDMRRQGVEGLTDNGASEFLLDTATNPESWVGGGAGIKKGANVIGKGISAVRRPSKFYGEGMKKVAEKAPEAKADFLNIIRNAADDPEAGKIIKKSKVIEKFGGTKFTNEGTLSENLSNLSLKDSQKVITSLKGSVRKAVLKGDVTSKELAIAEMFEKLSKAQNKSFKGMSGVKRGYGIAKNLGKGISKYGKYAAIGAATAGGGMAGASIVKPFLWR